MGVEDKKLVKDVRKSVEDDKKNAITKHLNLKDSKAAWKEAKRIMNQRKASGSPTFVVDDGEEIHLSTNFSDAESDDD